MNIMIPNICNFSSFQNTIFLNINTPARAHTVAFRVIRALQRLVASLPIICSALDSMACLVINGRPCYIIGAERPAFRDIVQGRREFAPSSRGKGMTLDVVDINGYGSPPWHKRDRHVSSQCRLAVHSRVYYRAHTLRQFIIHAGHHQHRYLRYYSDLCSTCNWARRRSYCFVQLLTTIQQRPRELFPSL